MSPIKCLLNTHYIEFRISNFEVSDFISDHRALHLSLRCLRSHPARKRIQVRALRRIRGDVLDADLASFIVDRECDDVNVVVTQYDDFLSKLLDKHAPLKEIDVVERQLNDWMTDDILLLKKIRHLLSYDACAQLIHALISICLDYCNSLLYNLPKGSIERLQKIQNQAARILTKTPRCDHISEVLVSLHWLKMEQRIIYKILILTVKAFVDHTAPLYLSELVKKKSSSTNTRSANDDLLLVIPPLSRICSNTFFERSFNFAAPTEWNRLDKRIQRISNLNTFKSEIKTILFLNYFDV